MAKKTNDAQAEYKTETLKDEYLLLDPSASSVSHNGTIYPVVNGKLTCPPDVAQKLIEGGVLKA